MMKYTYFGFLGHCPRSETVSSIWCPCARAFAVSGSRCNQKHQQSQNVGRISASF